MNIGETIETIPKNHSENQFLKKQICDLKCLLQMKDQEIMQHIRKYDDLQSKFDKSVYDSIPNNKMPYTKENKKHFVFPSADKIPNEKMREAYNKLYKSVKEIVDEKEIIFEQLKRETVQNEEQKNYIEILKNTIDATIVKLGLNQALQNQKYFLI